MKNPSKIIFIEYPKCTTCQKAKAFLEQNGVAFVDRHLKTEAGNPTAAELKTWAAKFGVPAKKFFNTSGLIYRGNDMKSRAEKMSEDEILEEIANPAHNGMLVKRPLLIGENWICIGFREKEWRERLGI